MPKYSAVRSMAKWPAEWMSACLLLIYVAFAVGLSTSLVKLVTIMSLVIYVGVAAFQLLTGRRWLPVLLVFLLVLIALGTPSSAWDARSIWLFHGKRIFYDSSVYTQLDGYAPWSHNDYPSFIPALMAGVAEVVGSWNEIFPKAVVPLALAPGLMAIFDRLPGIVPRMLFSVVLCWIGGVHLVDGYTDALLGVYFVATYVSFYDLFSKAISSGLIGAVLMSSLLVMVKNEGVALLLCIVGPLTLLAWMRSRKFEVRPLLAAALGALPLICWKLAVSHAGVSNDLAGGDVAGHLTHRMVDASSYGLIVRGLLLQASVAIFLLPLCLLAWMHGWNSRFSHALTACVAYIVILFLVYLSTPNDLAWHLSTSADRTMIPLSLLAAFIVLAGTDALGFGQPVNESLVRANGDSFYLRGLK